MKITMQERSRIENEGPGGSKLVAVSVKETEADSIHVGHDM